LQCLVAAVRPLRVEELAEILTFDFDAKGSGTPQLNPGWRWEDQEEAVMSACSSLVMIAKDEGSRIVQFSHFSVKEYLTSNRLAESSRDVSRYHIVLEPAHTILAQACLGVLLQLDDRVDHDKIKQFPLAGYAAEHWVKHAEYENVALRIKGGMECLFDTDKPHFAAWIWVYNEDRYPHSSTAINPQKPEAVPLYYAAKFGFHDLTEHLLVQRPEDIHIKGGGEVTSLHASSSRGHTNVVSLLIERFPDVDVRGGLEQTALHRASCFGHLEIVQLLLSHGSDINAKDKDGWTPLYAAATFGHLEVGQMLLQHGAEIDVSENGGRTPLHAASRNGHTEVVRLLLEHGADPHARDPYGQTPSYTYAKQEIIQLLSEYGSNSAK
jgi:ankyrin repeat protein